MVGSPNIDDKQPKGAAGEEAPPTAEQTLELIDRRKFSPDEIDTERRRFPRAAFRGVERIAPYVNGRFPQQNEFRQVQCHDISVGGFSFFMSHPPLVQTLVVALIINGQTKYLTAHVVRSVATITDEGLKFLIGCSFTGRLQSP